MTGEEPLRVDGARVRPEAVVDAELRTGRDDRYLVAALAALLFFVTPVGLALWLRSSPTTLMVETHDGTYRERVADDRAWAEGVVEEFGEDGTQ